jgi:rubrerythrin
MVTLVGTQKNFAEALQALIELDYDAVEAYQVAINRLDNKDYKAKLTEFKTDHQRHIVELSHIAREHNVVPPVGPSVKQWLTKGKAVLADLLGEKALLQAMLSNEMDTNAAYDAMNKHPEAWENIKEALKRGYADEKKHKRWLEETIENYQ